MATLQQCFFNQDELEKVFGNNPEYRRILDFDKIKPVVTEFEPTEVELSILNRIEVLEAEKANDNRILDEILNQINGTIGSIDEIKLGVMMGERPQSDLKIAMQIRQSREENEKLAEEKKNDIKLKTTAINNLHEKIIQLKIDRFASVYGAEVETINQKVDNLFSKTMQLVEPLEELISELKGLGLHYKSFNDQNLLINTIELLQPVLYYLSVVKRVASRDYKKISL